MLTVKQADLSVSGKGLDALAAITAKGTLDTRLTGKRDCTMELTVKNMDLDRIKSLIPANFGIKRLGGTVAGQIRTTQGKWNRMTAVGGLRAWKLDLATVNKGELN